MTDSIVSLAALSISALAAGAGFFSLWEARKLKKISKKFFSGRDGSDLEDILLSLVGDIKVIRDEQAFLENGLKMLKIDHAGAIQKLGLVRFNPFADGGGNFSFCLALLDGHNSGIVITSLHGREQNRIYSKKIESGKCESQLTDEEQQAIALANKLPIKQTETASSIN